MFSIPRFVAGWFHAANVTGDARQSMHGFGSSAHQLIGRAHGGERKRHPTEYENCLLACLSRFKNPVHGTANSFRLLLRKFRQLLLHVSPRLLPVDDALDRGADAFLVRSDLLHAISIPQRHRLVFE